MAPLYTRLVKYMDVHKIVKSEVSIEDGIIDSVMWLSFVQIIYVRRELADQYLERACVPSLYIPFPARSTYLVLSP